MKFSNILVHCFGIRHQHQLQQQQQQPQQQNQVGLSQIIKHIAQQVSNANPGIDSTHVYQVLVQLAKQIAVFSLCS